MQQQQMNYGEMGHDRPGFAYGGYENIPFASFQGEKLSGQASAQTPTASQRLTLAIASLTMFILLTFGMIGIAVATQASPWVALPILFVLFLFSTVAIIINVVFNQKA